MTPAELILQPQGIHHGDDAVQHGKPVQGCLGHEGGNGADGLCYGGGFADAAGLDDDVVELLHAGDVGQLLHEVHLQGTADAAVLQGYERFVLLAHYAPLGYEFGIDVHLPDVVDDDGKPDAALVLQDAVQQGCLAAAQITREQQDGYFFYCHFCVMLVFQRAKLPIIL